MMRVFRHISVLISISLGFLFSGCLGGSSAAEDYHPGLGIPRLSISASQDFDDTVYLDETAEQIFTVCNYGNATATDMEGISLSSPFAFAGGSYPGTGGSCGSGLVPSGCCTLVIEFRPQDTSLHSATLEISYHNGPSSSPKSVSTSFELQGVAGTSGSFDTETFGDDGVATSAGLGIGHGRGATDAHIRAIALDSDSRVIGVGYAAVGGSNDFAIVRYNVNGLLDETFGTSGMTTTSLGGNDIAYAVAIQADGKIVVAGSTGIARYTTAGVLDTSFSTDGIVPVGGSYLSIQSDGKILTSDYSSVRRYNSNGTLDTTIGFDVSYFNDCTGTYLYSIAVQSDGKFLVGGTLDTNAICVTNLGLVGPVNSFPSLFLRFNADGTPDSGFTAPVGVVGDQSTIISIQVLEGGKILVAGTDNGNGTLIVARLNSDGSVDTTFDLDGIWSSPGLGEGRSVLADANGRIYVATETSLIRLQANGGLDTTFNGTGSLATPASNGYSLKLQSNGKIVLGGSTVVGGQRVFTITRIWP